MNNYYLAYIGTNSVRGSRGIYTLRIPAQTLVPEIVSTRQFYNAGGVDLSRDDRYLYAACEGMTFRGLADGGVMAFRTASDGELEAVGGQRSFGQRTCCVSVDDAGENLYACNFYQGTFSAYSLANGVPQPARYTIAPPDIPGAFLALHCVKPIGRNYVGVISLTECAIVVYEAQTGKRVFSYEFPGHPFCRYIEVAGSCVYALMQDPGDVYVFRNRLEERQELELIQKVSIQEDDYQGRFGATTIRVTPDHSLMVAATRDANSLTVFRIREDGTLVRNDIVTLPGLVPRDFNISHDGALVVTALQKSDEVCVHTIDYEAGTLRYREGCKVGIPSPASAAVSSQYQEPA